MSQIDPASFLNGANSAFIAELYARYLDDPSSVDEGWRRFFAELRDEAPQVEAELEGPSWAPRKARIIGNGAGAGPEAKTNGGGEGTSRTTAAVAAVMAKAEGTRRSVAELQRATVDSI